MLCRWGVVSDEYGEGAPHTAGLAQPHPGVAPPPPGEDVVYHRYYQWVVFVLFLQASMFHLPRIVWKHLEGGLMKMLVGDFTDPLMLISKDRRLERVAFIRRYFQETTKVVYNRHIYLSTYLNIYTSNCLHIYISTICVPQGHGGYALSFFVCEVLALVNVIVQIYFTDA